jgi:hypothetical protein
LEFVWPFRTVDRNGIPSAAADKVGLKTVAKGADPSAAIGKGGESGLDTGVLAQGYATSGR